MAISWDDLKIKASEDEKAKWLAPWAGWIPEDPVEPLFLSKFGDWFLRRPDGSTDRLSVIEGQYTTIAHTPAEFQVLILSPDWAQLYLLSELVLKLHQRGLVPGPGQCYGFELHPLFTGGEIDLAYAKIMPIEDWQRICAETAPPPEKLS